MSEEKFLVVFLVVGAMLSLIYLIYSSVQEAKQNEREKEYQEYKKRRQEKMDKERQENSIKWNENIQSKFKGKLKYKTNKPIKVLIGDYTDSMAPYTNSILKTMGIETEVVPTASDIIDRINDGKEYDIIITNNVYSNGESGKTVLDTLKENEDFKTPIIILTVDHNARGRYLSYGFDEYIQKPISEENVINIFPKFIENLKFEKIKSNKSK